MQPRNQVSNTQIMQQQLSILAELQEESTQQSRAIRTVLLGALLATTIAGISVLLFFVTQTYRDIPIITYVLSGNQSGINMQNADELLFITVARFLIVFTISWLPITLLVSVITTIIENLRD